MHSSAPCKPQASIATGFYSNAYIPAQINAVPNYFPVFDLTATESFKAKRKRFQANTDAAKRTKTEGIYSGPYAITSTNLVLGTDHNGPAFFKTEVTISSTDAPT